MSTGNQFLDFLLIMMIAFTSYQMINTFNARRRIKKVIQVFPQRKRWFFVITSFLLLILGTAYLFIDPSVMGVVYILLGAYFVFIANEPIIFANEGLYFNGKINPWEDLGKWAFSDDGKYLSISFKRGGKDQIRTLPVRKEDQERMQNMILRIKRG